MPWRNEVGNDGRRQDGKAGSTKTLQPAEDCQLNHVLSKSAQHRSSQEDCERHHHEYGTAEPVPQSAEHGHAHGHGQGVGSDDPRHVAGTVELADDSG